MNGSLYGKTALRLLDNLSDSKLEMDLEVTGDGAELWEHCRNQHGRLRRPVEQVNRLYRIYTRASQKIGL